MWSEAWIFVVHTLESWVQIPLETWMCSASFGVVQSCVGGGLAMGWSPYIRNYTKCWKEVQKHGRKILQKGQGLMWAVAPNKIPWNSNRWNFWNCCIICVMTWQIIFFFNVVNVTYHLYKVGKTILHYWIVLYILTTPNILL
jgi:hypothetical protein